MTGLQWVGEKQTTAKATGKADSFAALRNDKQKKQATTKANAGVLRCAQNDGWKGRVSGG
jgi:hypothetical protein